MNISEPIIVAAIVSFAPTLIAATALFKLHKIHVDINGRVDQLVETTRLLARERGIQEQKEKEQK